MISESRLSCAFFLCLLTLLMLAIDFLLAVRFRRKRPQT